MTNSQNTNTTSRQFMAGAAGEFSHQGKKTIAWPFVRVPYFAAAARSAILSLLMLVIVAAAVPANAQEACQAEPQHSIARVFGLQEACAGSASMHTVAASVPANAQEACQSEPQHSIARLFGLQEACAGSASVHTVAASVPANAQKACQAEPQHSIARVFGLQEACAGSSSVHTVRPKTQNGAMQLSAAATVSHEDFFQTTVSPDHRRATIDLGLTLQRAPVPAPVADRRTIASIF